MLQIIQYQKTGTLSVEDVPMPGIRPGGVLVRNVCSLISAGTEKTSVETAQASMLGKAKSRPDLVKQVMENVKREGIKATYEKVKSRLDNYKELGYSSAGVVLESATEQFKVGDRVACGGAGFASHAEVIFVPKNLVTKMPEEVSFDEAAFATVGAIALQGVRQAEVEIGEYVAVIGLGLLGLITVQLLKANGCRVIGLDVNRSNFALSRRLGCDDCMLSTSSSIKKVESLTGGYGTDAVIITASTKSNEPLELALQFARKKSKVVVVGAVGMDVPRSPFYEKELDLRISCSYGPGRYDATYEERGVDYPIAYVRWTENRNMEAILSLIAQRRLDVRSLVTHQYPIQDALQAYDLITGKKTERYLGVMIQYPERAEPPGYQSRLIRIAAPDRILPAGQRPVVGFVGAGNFAQSYLIPPLQKLGVKLKGVATADAVSSKAVAKKFGFEYCTTEGTALLLDADVNVVVVATRHDSHARYVAEALKNGKHVFVEKPLATHDEELRSVVKAYTMMDAARPVILSVGFNRRFSLPLRDIAEFFSDRIEPLVMMYRVHAGFIPKTHWIQESGQGGRIVGEGCHFVDCMAFLTGARPVHVFAASIDSPNSQVTNDDNVAIVVKFSDGSVGNLLYLANGDSSVGKEYFEVYAGGKTAILDNFREVIFHSNGRRKSKKYDGTKGHKEELAAFMEAVAGRVASPIPFESICDTTATTFRIMESLKRGTRVLL